MISGNALVSTGARLLRVALAMLAGIAGAAAGSNGPAVALPAGFDRIEYASGFEQITGIEMLADGTLVVTRQDPRDRYEITPAHDGEPLSIRRVAVELARRDQAVAHPVVDTRARSFVRFEWHPDSGELTWTQSEPAQVAGRDVPLSAKTVRLAHTLATQPFMDVAIAPAGALFVADTKTGVIYRVSDAR
jgi:glucose/arabinose dehydrogenase